MKIKLVNVHVVINHCGICMKKDCSFNLRSRFPDTKNVNSDNPNPNPNSNTNPNPNPDPNLNSNPKPIPNTNSNPIPNPNSNPNPHPNPNSNPHPNPNPNVNDLRSSSFANNLRNNTNKVLTRKCNRSNSLKPLTDFDESKYASRNCTSVKVNCQYCAYLSI